MSTARTFPRPRTGSPSLEAACALIASGRRLARAIGRCARNYKLNESDVRLLHVLRAAAAAGIDQKRLADELELSPAQVSTIVERLNRDGWIAGECDGQDRRRQLWRLTDAGTQLLQTIATDFSALAPIEQSWQPPLSIAPGTEHSA